MKNLGWIIAGVLAIMFFKNQQKSLAQQTPADTLQAIADENAAFWASVGAPFSNQVTQEGGLSSPSLGTPDTSDVSIGGGFAT